MKSNKHILVLTPGFAASEADDSCIPALQVYLKSFHEQFPDYKISIIAFHYPFSSEQFVWNGIKVFPCNGKNKKGLARLFTINKAKSFFETIYKNEKVDLIHSFWLGECAVLGEKLSNKYSIPHLNTLMGQDVRTSNRFLKKDKLKTLSEVALSDRHAAEFEKSTNRKPIAIIPWGIEEDEISSNEERTIDILAAGSLIELKRYDLLIKAVAVIKNNFPAIRVTIAGGGESKNNLEKLSDEFGVRNNIDFKGQISRKEVLLLMKKSKVFVHPSSFESYGFVFAEGRKNGMAIVSFPVGIAENSENWKVVEDLEQFIFAIKYFLTNKINFSSEIIHSAKETSKLYAALYEKMMDRK